MVYVDNLVQGVALAERHPAAPGQAFWVADRDAYPLRDVVATVRQALDEEGFRTRDTVVRIPRVLAAMAETADRALQRRGRYSTQVHVLGELAHTIRCDISRSVEVLGYDPQVGLLEGMRRSVRWCVREGYDLGPAHGVAAPPGADGVSVRTALVTGGSGYFGSLLVEHLLAAGYHVRVLDLVDAADRPADVELVRGDIRDATAVGGAVAGVDVVFHNVAQVPLAKDRSLFESVNVGGTAVLLGACERAGVAKVVHTSSSAVFGVPRTNPVTRATEPRPVEPYGRAKLDAELLCRAAVSRGLDVSVVRPRTILGHGRLGIFGILFDWIADGASVPVLGSGDNVYQFVHAADLADACRRAAERPGSCGLQHRRRAIRHHARGTGGTVRARGHRRPGAQSSGRADRGCDEGQRRTRGESVRALPLDHVRTVDVVRHLPGSRRAGVAGAVVERGDAARLLRLVPRPARRRPQRRLGPSPYGESGARAAGQAAALRRLRWSTPRRRP